MPDGAYAEPEDVRRALQERSLDGALGTDNVEPALRSISDWLAGTGNRHWFDSTGSQSDLVPTAPATTGEVLLDVPSSPHVQRGQIHAGREDIRYPVTQSGQYARVVLPHAHVQSLSALRIRDRGGGVTDWVAASDKTEGRGEDYYLVQPGQQSYGKTYLYLHAPSIGPRYDLQDLLTLDYDYGLDAQSQDWQDVRRGVAQLAAAQLAVDDDVRTAIPDSGQLIGIDSRRQALVDDGRDALEPYLTAPA